MQPHITDEVLVSGHGGLDTAAGETFVPGGMSLIFHAESGADLRFRAGLRIIALKPTSGINEIHGSRSEFIPVPNYTLGALSELQFAAQSAVVSENGYPVIWIGQETPSEIDLCSGEMCTPSTGHACEGLLGLLSRFGYANVHFIVCRSVAGDETAQYTSTVPSDLDPDYLEIREAQVEYMVRLINGPPEQALQYWRAISEVERSYLLSRVSIISWYHTLGASQVLHERGAFGLLKYLRSPGNEEAASAILADSSLSNRIEYAQRVEAAFVDENTSYQSREDLIDEFSADELREFADLTPTVAKYFKDTIVTKEPDLEVFIRETASARDREHAFYSLTPLKQQYVRGIALEDEQLGHWLAVLDNPELLAIRELAELGRVLEAYTRLVRLSAAEQTHAEYEPRLSRLIAQVTKLLTQWTSVLSDGISSPRADAWLARLWAGLTESEKVYLKVLAPEVVENWLLRTQPS